MKVEPGHDAIQIKKRHITLSSSITLRGKSHWSVLRIGFKRILHFSIHPNAESKNTALGFRQLS